jgi:hypothetical protein
MRFASKKILAHWGITRHRQKFPFFATEAKKLKFIDEIKNPGMTIRTYPETPPQCLRIALTVAATLCSGKSTQFISLYLWVFSMRSTVSNTKDGRRITGYILRHITTLSRVAEWRAIF